MQNGKREESRFGDKIHKYIVYSNMANYMINLKITICVSELGYLGEGIAHCERYMVQLCDVFLYV